MEGFHRPTVGVVVVVVVVGIGIMYFLSRRKAS